MLCCLVSEFSSQNACKVPLCCVSQYKFGQWIQNMIGNHCQSNLCWFLVSLHNEALVSKLILSSNMINSQKRKHVYSSFVNAEYGLIGAHNHLKIPECIVTCIHFIYPSDDGNHKHLSSVLFTLH